MLLILKIDCLYNFRYTLFTFFLEDSIYFLFLKKESSKEIQGPSKDQFLISGLRYDGPLEQSWSPSAKFYKPPLRAELTTQ